MPTDNAKIILGVTPTYVIIFVACACGIAWGIWNTASVLMIKIQRNKKVNEIDLGSENISSNVRINEEKENEELQKIGKIISDGANSFLKAEYTIQGIFVVIFALIIYSTVDDFTHCYTTISYILGACISMACGFIGMKIAVAANYRTASKARESLAEAFQCAFQAGNVMGFILVSLSLLVMTILVLVYIEIYNPTVSGDRSFSSLFDYVAGYGLGGSSMALFGRVGGGIYTKAADVGADIAGKLEKGLAEDHPKNPATIADNVGDNVGDIAGMGSDLFGSFAESTCAALVVSASTSGNFIFLNILQPDSQTWSYNAAILFPLLISAVGIIVCIGTAAIGIWIYKVDSIDKIEKALKLQLLISTALMIVALVIITLLGLPNYLDIQNMYSKWLVPLCVGGGLIAGFIIGMVTDFYTSNAHYPVRELVYSCEGGPATNVIFGLALGYNSTILPIILLCIVAYLGNRFLGMYGVALAALGMLSTLSLGLAIDAYGPISDNAGGISEMAELPKDVREKTDALDAAGNTTAAIGKGFAIGSAALVSLSLFGAFLSRAELCAPPSKLTCSNLKPGTITLDNPLIFSFLLFGAMLPYAFSALTMQSVGMAAGLMVEEVRKQINGRDLLDPNFIPNYNACIQVSTKASLKEMIIPGVMVIFTPLLMGVFIGPYSIAGLLPGALISGVQLAISMSNTGGAWDNCKKLIESEKWKNSKKEILKKKSEEHKAAVVGDTIGDPLKDTSGPSLNILIKLMAILSLVFSSLFVKTGFLQSWLLQV